MCYGKSTAVHFVRFYTNKKEELLVLRILLFLLMLSAPFPTIASHAADRNHAIVTAAATRSGYREPIVVKRWTTKVSWYGPGFHGKRMANRAIFNQHDPTVAACPSRNMLGRRLRLTNPTNGKVLEVTCQDVGPNQKKYPDRGLDLAKAGAEALGYRERGIATLIVEELA